MEVKVKIINLANKIYQIVWLERTPTDNCRTLGSHPRSLDFKCLTSWA